MQELLDVLAQDKQLVETMVTLLSKNEINVEDDAAFSRTHAALAARLAQLWKEPCFHRERLLAMEEGGHHYMLEADVQRPLPDHQWPHEFRQNCKADLLLVQRSDERKG